MLLWNVSNGISANKPTLGAILALEKSWIPSIDAEWILDVAPHLNSCEKKNVDIKIPKTKNIFFMNWQISNKLTVLILFKQKN